MRPETRRVETAVLFSPSPALVNKPGYWHTEINLHHRKHLHLRLGHWAGEMPVWNSLSKKHMTQCKFNLLRSFFYNALEDCKNVLSGKSWHALNNLSVQQTSLPCGRSQSLFLLHHYDLSPVYNPDMSNGLVKAWNNSRKTLNWWPCRPKHMKQCFISYGKSFLK